ncbi:MAG: RNA-binding S4 domain-containing protein [Lysobacterales bacterium]
MTLPVSGPAELRADVWLWAARFFKTRSLARQAIEAGRVEVNDAGCKPAKGLRVGDHLRVGRAEERLEVSILALSARRGPASEAHSCIAKPMSVAPRGRLCANSVD